MGRRHMCAHELHLAPDEMRQTPCTRAVSSRKQHRVPPDYACLAHPAAALSPSCVQFELNEGDPVGSSVPATEHSVMTSWHTEQAAIENMIQQFGSGMFACVMDSYDYAVVRTLSCQAF